MVKKIIKGIFTAIMHISMICIIGCLLLTAVQRSKGEHPNLFGYTIYVILTDSMTGELEVGEAILSKKTDDYEVGSIVTYVATSGVLTGQPITHKIVKIYEENGVKMVQTAGVKKGAIIDNPIRADQIEAVMQKKINVPVGVVSFFQKPIAMMCVFVLPILIFAGYEMYILIMKKDK
jgi:signal peptidase I